MTPAALKQAVLEEIGRAPAGGPYPPDDVAKVTEKYVTLHAELLAQGLVTWDITEEVPESCSGPVLAMLAFACAGVYGVGEPRYSRLRLEGSFGAAPQSLAEKKLRRALAVRFVSAPVETAYF